MCLTWFQYKKMAFGSETCAETIFPELREKSHQLCHANGDRIIRSSVYGGIKVTMADGSKQPPEKQP
jgi:hypothetical protein